MIPPTNFKWPIICGVDCQATMYRSWVTAVNWLIGQLSPIPWSTQNFRLFYDTWHHNSFNMWGWLSSYTKPFSHIKLLKLQTDTQTHTQTHSAIAIIKIDTLTTRTFIYGAWPHAVSRFEIAITFERIGLFAQNFQGCFTMVGAMFWQGFWLGAPPRALARALITVVLNCS